MTAADEVAKLTLDGATDTAVLDGGVVDAKAFENKLVDDGDVLTVEIFDVCAVTLLIAVPKLNPEAKDVLVVPNNGLLPKRELLLVSVVGEEKLKTAAVVTDCVEELTAAFEAGCSVVVFAVVNVKTAGLSKALVVANKLVCFGLVNKLPFVSDLSETILEKLGATLALENTFPGANRPSDALLVKTL